MSQPPPGCLSRYKLAILFIFFGLPILVCGGGVTWWFARQAAADQEVQQMRAEILARGLPLDDQSLMEFRAREIDRDKSEAWTNINEIVASEEFTQSYLGIPVMDSSLDDLPLHADGSIVSSPQVREFLDRWSELLTDIHDTTQGSGAIWTAIQFEGFDTDLSLLQSARVVSRLLALEHRDAMAREDHDAAFHSLLAMIGTARSQEAEPLLIGQLIHAALLSLALERLRATIEQGALDQRQLSEILTQLRPLDDYGNGYRLGIIGERATSQPIFDNPGGLDPNGGDPRLNIMGLRRSDALASLKLMKAAEDIATDDLTRFFADSEKLEAQFNASVQQANALEQFETILTSLLTPAIGAYGKSVVRNTMQVRIAKIGIGLRLFQQKNGHWPASLDELTAENIGVELGPINPIGDRPFGYKITDDTAELWGFAPESSTDVTPAEPMDLTTLQGGEWRAWEYWHWVMPLKTGPPSR